MFTHVRDCIERMFSLHQRRELDHRLELVKRNHRFGELTSKLPNKPYFENAAAIPAFEHKAAFQVILAIGDGVLSPEVEEALRNLANWHKYAIMLEFTE